MQQTFSNNNNINNIVIKFTDYLQMLSFLTSQRRFLPTCKTLFTKLHRSSPNGFLLFTLGIMLPRCRTVHWKNKKEVVKCMLRENDDTTQSGRTS